MEISLDDLTVDKNGVITRQKMKRTCSALLTARIQEMEFIKCSSQVSGWIQFWIILKKTVICIMRDRVIQ